MFYAELLVYLSGDRKVISGGGIQWSTKRCQAKKVWHLLLFGECNGAVIIL